jgi:peptidoglycan/xylan/chitin deacetylase (PgdA/CDA1 family)
MTGKVSALWQPALPGDIDQQLREICGQAAQAPGSVQIFFRADDIGRIEKNCTRMLELFRCHAMPLCPALVPQWTSRENWRQMQDMGGDSPLFCWHQHGYSHHNHEARAKKNEFGDGRSRAELHRDISAGKEQLERLLGKQFFPVFTPPWNRCSSEAMQILLELDFQALSRSTNVLPDPPAGLEDLMINIDLHTRREKDPGQGMDNLLEECRAALSSGRMGFMLHHQRMNDNAFQFLEHLFQAIAGQPKLLPCTFRELLHKA